LFWPAPLVVAQCQLLALLLACPSWATLGRAQATPAGDPPPLPPFAGVLINAQRFGDLAVYCTSPGAAPLDSRAPRRTRVWVLNRERLEEARSAENLCDPAISPNADRFVAVSPTALWLFSIPLDHGTMVRGSTSAPRSAPLTSEVPRASYARPQWSPNGRFISVVVSSSESTRVEVLSVETGLVVATSAPGATSVKWSPDASTVMFDDTVVRLP
jgi:hypothetical protein